MSDYDPPAKKQKNEEAKGMLSDMMSEVSVAEPPHRTISSQVHCRIPPIPDAEQMDFLKACSLSTKSKLGHLKTSWGVQVAMMLDELEQDRIEAGLVTDSVV